MRCRFCEADTVDGPLACAQCGRELELPAGSLISGRYEIQRFIDDGGMGTVYLAQDRHLDEAVALKFLRHEFVRTPTMAKRFRSEIKLARRVSHRNVCKIFDYGQDGGRVYITMAYVDGVDLRRTLGTQGPFPPQEAFAIAADVADALQAVHDEGIVHRDLKTSNIMRDRKGLVRLMDFGVAKDQAGEATELTAAGSLIGSPAYMSPEQWNGQRADVRSDIYALGIVVYELFTGRVPFQADNHLALKHRHLDEPPPIDGDVAARLPASLRPILRRALAKEPSERYASAKEMAEAIHRARTECQPRAVEPIPPAILPRAPAQAVALPVEQEAPVPEVADELETLLASLPTPVPKPRAETLEDYATADVPPVRSLPAVEPKRGPGAHTARRKPSKPAQPGRERLLLGARLLAGTTVVVVIGVWMLWNRVDREPPAVVPSAAGGASPPSSSVPTTSAVTLPTAPPPSRQQAVQETGTLRVTSVPVATISVDGVPVTGSSLKIPLSVGTHLVRLELAGYQPIERRVQVQAGQVARLDIDFEVEGVREP